MKKNECPKIFNESELSTFELEVLSEFEQMVLKGGNEKPIGPGDNCANPGCSGAGRTCSNPSCT